MTFFALNSLGLFTGNPDTCIDTSVHARQRIRTHLHARQRKRIQMYLHEDLDSGLAIRPWKRIVAFGIHINLAINGHGSKCNFLKVLILIWLWKL